MFKSYDIPFRKIYVKSVISPSLWKTVTMNNRHLKCKDKWFARIPGDVKFDMQGQMLACEAVVKGSEAAKGR